MPCGKGSLGMDHYICGVDIRFRREIHTIRSLVPIDQCDINKFKLNLSIKQLGHSQRSNPRNNDGESDHLFILRGQAN